MEWIETMFLLNFYYKNLPSPKIGWWSSTDVYGIIAYPCVRNHLFIIYTQINSKSTMGLNIMLKYIKFTAVCGDSHL
jgi:hypothetical protein